MRDLKLYTVLRSNKNEKHRRAGQDFFKHRKNVTTTESKANFHKYDRRHYIWQIDSGLVERLLVNDWFKITVER